MNKYILYIMAILFSSSYALGSNYISKTDKLDIEGVQTITGSSQDDSSPSGWLRFYESALKFGFENVVVLRLKLDVNDVESFMIADINAVENKCGMVQSQNLFYMKIGGISKNKNKVTIWVNKPCFDNRKSRLRLTVKTKNNKYYYNEKTLKASKNAFQYYGYSNISKYTNKGFTETNKIQLKILNENTDKLWADSIEPSYPGKSSFIPIEVKVGIKGINKIMLEDINALKGFCSKNTATTPLIVDVSLLATSNNNFLFQIPEPCYQNGFMNYSLKIRMLDGRQYYRVFYFKK